MNTKADRKNTLVRRFSTWRIVEHWILIITFLVLAVTGLSQKFHMVGISQWIIELLGGISASRLIHHASGTVFVLLIVQHIVVTSTGILLGRWSPSMLISLKDFQDALNNVKYYLGLENSPAKCDRFDYKEKFVYWLVLVGGIQMVATGFMLWFPISVTRYLPGQFIPAAKVMHTNEAMLIFLLVAIWHIYDSLFSPEVFPIDTSIFTGYIDRKRMEISHPVELVRMDSGANDEHAGIASAALESPHTLTNPADNQLGRRA